MLSPELSACFRGLYVPFLRHFHAHPTLILGILMIMHQALPPTPQVCYVAKDNTELWILLCPFMGVHFP